MNLFGHAIDRSILGALFALSLVPSAGCGGGGLEAGDDPADWPGEPALSTRESALEGVPAPFDSVYRNCLGHRWLGAMTGSPETTPSGSLLRFEHGLVFSGRTHRGCLRGDLAMVDGRLLDNPDSLTLDALSAGVEQDPVLPRYRKCVVRTLIDQRAHRDQCGYAHIHPYCSGATTAWCSEFASWVYLHSGMRNIEGPYRHMSSVTSGPELANVFDSQWIEREDVRSLTAAAGDVITMDNSEGNSHTTLIVAVRQDSRQMFTIGGNEGGTVRGPTARDYFDPTVWGQLRGIGKIQSSWFDFESGYLPGCQGAAPAFELSPRDFRGGREEALVGRNTFCGTLLARGENLEGNCQTSTVNVVHDGTVKATLALHALESVALTQVAAGPNRVELQARCGAQSRSEIYHRDTRAPSFRELRVYMSGTRIAIEPVGLSDDGYWLSSDYDLRVVVDGGSERSHRGSVALLQGLAAGAHTARVRVGDGCDRLSASQTVTFSVNGSGQLLDPAAGTGSGPCPVGQQRNALGRCVAASCDGERGWIFDPAAAAGNGGCVCAPPGHPLYNPTDCIY